MPAKFRRDRRWRSGTLRGPVWAAPVLCFGWTMGARGAAIKVVPVAEFRADVSRLQHLVAECESSLAACDAAQVGPDERVSPDPERRDEPEFAMHWQWLRDALTQAHGAKDGREAELRAAAARLDEIAQESGAATAAAGTQPGFSRARATVNDVLAQPEFQADEGPGWWDRQKSKLFHLLARIFMGADRLGQTAPWIGKLLEWLLFTGAAVGLLILLLRNAARQRLRVAFSGSAAKAAGWDREAPDWEQLADGHAGSGEWRDAVHCLFWAAIVLLESRRAWRHNPTRTPREYVRLLKANSAQRESLRRLTQIFERTWYGGQEPGASEYRRARQIYEELAAAAESRSSFGIGSAADAAGSA